MIKTPLYYLGQTLSFEAVMKVKDAVRAHGDESSQRQLDSIYSRYGNDLVLDTTATVEDIVFNPINIASESNPRNKPKLNPWNRPRENFLLSDE